MGVSCVGVGRSPRDASPVFGPIHGRDDRLSVIADADWVIASMPETSETDNYFGAEEFSAMRPSTRFINVGRGNSVDEVELLAAIKSSRIAGAALDVFRQEPLPPDSELWSTSNLIISPHVSGDYRGFEQALCSQFLANLAEFLRGARLVNIVDKRAGYVRSI
jgi:phosphoglycerate dehydrogenase-like enzyme